MGRNMTEVEFPRRLLLPRDLNPHPISADFRQETAYRGRDCELEGRDKPATNDGIQDQRPAEMSTEAALNRLSRKPVDEMAIRVQGLTYGEMIELSEALWKFRTGGSGVTQETLPALLHHWSKSRSATAGDS
jgi:hypothetical protein